MGPLGMGDELRVALRIDGATWGYLCLHRSGDMGFTARELAVVGKLAPHAAEAMRRLAVAAPDEPGRQAEGCEAVVLVADHAVLAVAGAVDEIDGGPLVAGGALPLPLAAVVRRLEAIETRDAGLDGAPPAVRMRTTSGVLVTVHGARLRDESGAGPIVLTIAPAAAAERSSLLLVAHGLTPAQCRVAKLVLQGRTTGQIVVEAGISAHTVQDHLKAVFDKVGVRSRRELVGALMQPSH